MIMPHHLQFPDMTQAILGFAELARSNELNVGLKETQEAIEIASFGLVANKRLFQFALKSVFCGSQEQTIVFDEIFSWFWGDQKAVIKSHITYKNQTNIQKQSERSLVLMGKGHSSGTENEEEGKNVSGANSTIQLRKTDFSMVSTMEGEHLEKLAILLWKQMSNRLRRKYIKSKTKGKIDIRQTIRNNVNNGGALLDLQLHNRKPDKSRLVILLDVSGSMDKYSFYLLRFILALRIHFKRIDAYIFSTNLIRITPFLGSKNLKQVLQSLSQYADNWSSGTKIGECLKHFNQAYARRSLSGKNMTIILSDGLDTGEPDVLQNELHKIKLRTRKLIWLNPLKGMKGYQPRTRGMLAALPEVDHFLPSHNIDSLLELESFLSKA